MHLDMNCRLLLGLNLISKRELLIYRAIFVPNAYCSFSMFFSLEAGRIPDDTRKFSLSRDIRHSL